MFLNKDVFKVLGLDSGNIKIIESLNDKELTILEISKITQIPRTSLYYILPKLSERGFIEKIRVNKKVKWKKIDEDIVRQNYLNFLKDDSQQVKKIRISDSAEIKILKKNKNVLNVFEDILTLPKRSRFCGIQPQQSLINVVTRNNINKVIDFNNGVKEKGLIVEGIIHEKGTVEMARVLEKNKGRELLESFHARSADTAKLPDDYLKNVNAEVYLYDKKVAIVNWKEEFGVIIENEDVFTILKAMFESTKYMLDKYDQNEKIARMLVDEVNDK